MRHGLTPLNKQKKVNGEIDEPLAIEGFKEARNIAPLIPKTIKYIYCSPLLRAKQTAETINQKLHLPIFIEDKISEIRMGTSLAGKSWEEMEGGLELKNKHRTVRFDYHKYGGESVFDVKKRLIVFFKKINNKYYDDEVLLISHGGIVRVISFLEFGKSIYETVKHLSPIKVDLNVVLKNYSV